MERVLLGTVAASGVRVAQYVGGSAMSKAHRGDSGTDTPPVTPVAWSKQRAAVQMVMEQILPISIGNDNDASRSNSNSNSTANRLYPPASQDRYMIQRAKPAWCNGHGALFDYCYGQEPVHMAEKLNSVKIRVLAAMFDANRLNRLDLQATSVDTGSDELAMTVAEILDSGTRSMWGEEGRNTTVGAGTAAATAWPMQRSWVTMVGKLAQTSSSSGVIAAAYGELLALQDRAESTLETLAAMPSPQVVKERLSARSLRGHLKSQLVMLNKAVGGNEEDKTRTQMHVEHSAIVEQYKTTRQE